MNNQLMTNRDLEALGYNAPARSILRQFAGFPQPDESGGTMETKRMTHAAKIERWQAAIARLRAELEQAED